MTDQFSIESFTASHSVLYLSDSYQKVNVTFTATINDARWDPNSNAPQNIYLAEINNTYTWSEAYSYSTYNLAKDNASKQNVVIDSNNLGTTNYSIPGTTHITGNNTIYTWTKTYNISNFSIGSTTDNLTVSVSDENNNTHTKTIDIIIIKIATAFRLDGSLSIHKSALNDVTNLLDTSVQFELETAERDKSTGSLSYNYYIQAKYNLNKEITYTPSNTTDNLDDAYMFNGVTITNVNAIDATLNLPTADDISINAGLIDALDRDNNSIGNFPVTLLLSVNNIGTLSGSISISGDNVIPNVVDSNLLAQYAYWPINSFTLPSVNSNTADNLVPLSSSNLSSHFSGELDTILNYYQNVNLIKSWTIFLNNIDSTSDNALAKHARNIGNTGTKYVFSEGDKVVASLPQTYEITVNDYQGNKRIIVNNNNVYGVIVHSNL
jgi:hypothetical protein